VIERLYTAPPEGSVVVCLDEMGPQSAKSYPGRRMIKPAPPKAQRAKQEIDYGRRGKGYVFGAFRPATGEAFTETYAGRTTANWVDFLGQIEGRIDDRVARVYAVMDNLNVHSATDVLLFALAYPRWEFVFQPKYAAYQSDRAVVEDPTLAGAQGPPLRGVARDQTGRSARHRVLERAQAPLRLGPPTAAPHPAAPRDRCRAECHNNLADAPLRSI
jgi:hypothetical protein